MEQLELLGAPLAWFWLSVVAQLAVLPALVRGFLRHGTGRRYQPSFSIQRAPQLAIAVAIMLVMLSFEAIELRLGTGEPAFGRSVFWQLGTALPVLSLALVLPAAWAGLVSWLGVALVLLGIVFLVWGMHVLSTSFSTDAELLDHQELRRGGPFRYVLHPVYSGFALFLLGSAVVTLSPLVLLFTMLVVVPLLLRRARYEESLLVQEFGATYRALQGAVGGRRLIPTFFPAGF